MGATACAGAGASLSTTRVRTRSRHAPIAAPTARPIQSWLFLSLVSGVTRLLDALADEVLEDAVAVRAAEERAHVVVEGRVVDEGADRAFAVIDLRHDAAE